MDNGRTLPSLVWWGILTAIIGFIRYRRALISQVERFHARASHWQMDRLALEIPFVVTPLLLPLAAIAANILREQISSWHRWL